MKINKKHLRDKGWSEEEIEKTIKICKRLKKKTHKKNRIFSNVFFTVSLVIAVLGNFFVSLFLIPLLLLVNNIFIYVIVALLGLAFGAIISILIQDIWFIESKQHIILSFIVPAAGVVNFFIIVGAINTLSKSIKYHTYHSPALISITYLVFFFIPYVYLIHRRMV